MMQALRRAVAPRVLAPGRAARRGAAASLRCAAAAAAARGPSSSLSELPTAPTPPPFALRPFSSADPGPRPFRVLGLQQIAVGSLSKQSMSDIWTDVLGLTKAGSFVSEKENVDEDILVLGKEGSPFAVEVDLMTPLDAEKSPKVHSPSLNHIGLWVDDLPLAVEWMEKKGVRFTPGGIRKGASGHDVTFIHPKGKGDSPIGGAGVLIELVQAPPHVVEATKE